VYEKQTQSQLTPAPSARTASLPAGANAAAVVPPAAAVSSADAVESQPRKRRTSRSELVNMNSGVVCLPIPNPPFLATQSTFPPICYLLHPTAAHKTADGWFSVCVLLNPYNLFARGWLGPWCPYGVRKLATSALYPTLHALTCNLYTCTRKPISCRSCGPLCDKYMSHRVCMWLCVCLCTRVNVRMCACVRPPVCV